MVDVKQSDFEIDRFRLDEEWVEQPNLYFRYVQLAADARQDFDEAKASASVVRAEVEMDVRENPGEHGVAKVTEALVRAAVEASPKVQLADKKTIKARHAMDVVQGAVSALDHRKKALGDLVSLYLADYFSKPVARTDGKEAAEQFDKRRARRSQRRASGDV